MPKLSDAEINDILAQNDDLKTIRAESESEYELLSHYVSPKKIKDNKALLTPRCDSTAIHSNELLAASLNGTLTASHSKWFSLKLRDYGLNQNKEVKEWLQLCEDKIYLAIRQSNFNSEAFEVYLDLGCFGTGCLLCEEKEIVYPGFNGLLFRSTPFSEYCISENAEGVVNTVFREFKITSKAAVRKWANAEKNEKIKKLSESNPYEYIDILHCVYPSEENDRQFLSYYISIEDKVLLHDQVYHSFPYCVPRWAKTSGSVYGYGPGHVALPDIKTLNKAKELDLESWALDILPPTFEKEYSVIGSLRMQPAARNIAKDRDSIWTLNRNVRYDVTQIKEEAIRTSIRQIFYSDQLKLQEGPEMTATEVQVRYELMQRLLGPTIGRLENEFLNVLIERVFDILTRAGVLPVAPAILTKNGASIDIEYEGPLAKSQRSAELTALKSLYSLVGELSRMKQDNSLFDLLDDDKAIITAADILGVQTRIFKDEKVVKEIRKGRAHWQATEQQKLDAERTVEGVGKLAPAMAVAKKYENPNQ